MTVIPSVALGGTLGGIAYGHQADFYDWEYAKKVWREMPTWEAEEAEWAKYSADFEPWFAEYKKGYQKAKEALKSYPPDKRQRIERAHDIQMAWDTWRTTQYSPWFSEYKGLIGQARSWSPLLEELKPFAKSNADFNLHLAKTRPAPCEPKKALTECGPMPDWRSPRMIAEERKLEARLAELLKGRP